MIRWFHDNPVGLGLASFCGVLLLITGLLVFVWALPPSAPGRDVDDGDSIAGLDLPELRGAGELEDYSEIITRPAFNESRQPVIDLSEDEDGMDDGEDVIEEVVDAPDVELAGVIITPTLRMATLKEKGQEVSLVGFVGRPLEGNYGSWQITRIEPREVTLTSGDGEELQLQLQVHNAKIATPPKTPEPLAAAAGEQATESPAVENGTEPLSRAEEIRQRIAERREELQRAAESEQAGTEVNYQQAIQNMMGKKRQENSNNEQK